MPFEQPLVVNIRTSLWCRQTVFLPVIHEVDRPPPFPASLSSPVAGHSSYRCARAVANSSDLPRRLSCNVCALYLWQCCCSLCLSSTLWMSSYNISFRMSVVFWRLRLLLSTSRQHRADDKRHMPPADMMVHSDEWIHSDGQLATALERL